MLFFDIELVTQISFSDRRTILSKCAYLVCEVDEKEFCQDVFNKFLTKEI